MGTSDLEASGQVSKKPDIGWFSNNFLIEYRDIQVEIRQILIQGCGGFQTKSGSQLTYRQVGEPLSIETTRSVQIERCDSGVCIYIM